MLPGEQEEVSKAAVDIHATINALTDVGGLVHEGPDLAVIAKVAIMRQIGSCRPLLSEQEHRHDGTHSTVKLTG